MAKLVRATLLVALTLFFAAPPTANAGNTVTYDPTVSAGSVDLNLTDVSQKRLAAGNQPDQVHITYISYNELYFIWSTGAPSNDVALPVVNPSPDTATVPSILQYGTESGQYSSVVFGFVAAYSQIYPGEGNYTSGVLHYVHAVFNPSFVANNPIVYYIVGDGATWTNEAVIQLLPGPSFDNLPIVISFIGDVGDTLDSATTLSLLPDDSSTLVYNLGDLTFADLRNPNDTLRPDGAKFDGSGTSSQIRWDAWGRLTNNNFGNIPQQTVAGEHDIEFQPYSNTSFASYIARYGHPYADVTSGTELYYSFDTTAVHTVVLSPYVDFDKSSAQHAFFVNDIENGLNRLTSPWLVVLIHAPFYSSYVAHYRENECFRQVYEPLFYKYGVDIVASGHVHGYERSVPAYNYIPNPCGATHLVVGNGGSPLLLDTVFVDNSTNCPTLSADTQPAYYFGIAGGGFCASTAPDILCPPDQALWSAYREPSYGHGRLTVNDANSALWEFVRNQDFPNNDTGIVPPPADSFTIIRNIKACKNKAFGAVSALTPAPTKAPIRTTKRTSKKTKKATKKTKKTTKKTKKTTKKTKKTTRKSKKTAAKHKGR